MTKKNADINSIGHGAASKPIHTSLVAPKRAGTVYTDEHGASRIVMHHDHPLANCSPRDDRVIVRREQAADRTRGGIILVAAEAHRRQIGRVVAVGPGKRLDNGELYPLGIKPGDRVIITGFAGLEISEGPGCSTEADEFVMLRAEDVTAFLD